MPGLTFGLSGGEVIGRPEADVYRGQPKQGWAIEFHCHVHNEKVRRSVIIRWREPLVCRDGGRWSYGSRRQRILRRIRECRPLGQESLRASYRGLPKVSKVHGDIRFQVLPGQGLAEPRA